MQRRWLIRGIFIALLLFSFLMWHWIVVRYDYIPRHYDYYHGGKVVSSIGIYTNVYYANWKRGGPGIPAWYYSHACSYRSRQDHLGILHIQPTEVWYSNSIEWLLTLKLGFDLRLSLPPPNGRGCTIMFPLWFPCLVCSLALAFIWRKTRRPSTEGAFIIEPQQK